MFATVHPKRGGNSIGAVAPGRWVNGLAKARPDGLFSGREITFSVTDRVISVSDKPFSMREKPFSATDNTFSTADNLFFATDISFSGSDKTFSGRDKTFSAAQKGFSSAEKGLSAMHKGLSGTEKRLWAGQNRVRRPNSPSPTKAATPGARRRHARPLAERRPLHQFARHGGRRVDARRQLRLPIPRRRRQHRVQRLERSGGAYEHVRG